MKEPILGNELEGLIERIPDRFNYLLTICLAGIIAAIFCGGKFIKSPETITAEIRITNTHEPIVLKAKTMGKIKLLINDLPRECSRDQYIAVIENPADPDRIKRLLSYLNSINPAEFDETVLSNSDAILGDISIDYSNFLKTVDEYRNMIAPYNQRVYEVAAIKREMVSDSVVMDYHKSILKEDLQTLAIRKKTFITDSILFSKSVILESAYNQSLMEYIEIKKQILTERNVIANAENSVLRRRAELENVEYQYTREMKAAKESLWSAYYTLLSRIHSWESSYVFKADVNGVVEYANLISENSFISAGEQVFTIIPSDAGYYGVAFLPFSGAGNVKVGQTVNIKMSSYPYAEYGMLIGKVQQISKNVIEKGYYVYVCLPDGLESTTHKRLNLAETMYGTAEIVTENKRLIDKVFYHIYDLFHV